MTKYLYIMILLMVGLASCDDENPSDEAVLFDIVCLEKASNTGSIFSLAKPGSDEEIMLTASQQLDSRYVKPGDRLLLKYVPMSGIAYKSGAISIIGYGQIINGELDSTEESVPDGWNQDPVYLLSAWRAGRYLNLHIKLPYDENPRDFRLVMPKEQVDTQYPDIYLVHALEADVTTFSRAYYASFDVAMLIDNPQIKGFTLHLNNSNLTLDALRFDKQ